MSNNIVPSPGQSFLAQQVLDQNFTPQQSANLAVGAVSASVTFPTLTGAIRQTFKITNKGTHGAYVGWGQGSAVAVASTGTPAAMCDYVAAGAIITQDYQLVGGGIVDTIAAIQDGGSTTLEITIGFGQ